MQARIGYLIPEFPGQTHIFFWRERRALEKLGVQAAFVSTRQPDRRLIAHSWSQEAMASTDYLAPLSWRAALGSAGQILRGFPAGWWRCISAILRAEGYAGRKRVRLGALAVMGAQLSWLAKRRGWSHVHVHSCADSAHVAMFARLLRGLPYSLTLHGPLSYYGPNQGQKWRHAAFAVAISRTLLAEARAVLNGSLPPCVEVAPMGVELDQFQRRTPYKPWAGQGQCRIFSCGRLNVGKGHADLIRAVAIMRSQGLDAHLRIAGEDDSQGHGYRHTLEGLIGELALGGHVELLGAVSEEVVRAELEAAHVFALASHEEALGVATMEAMAMSVPVVVTGVGGVPELVSDGEDGLLVPPHQPGQMAEGIAKVLRDAGSAGRLSGAARGKIERSFGSHLSAGIIAGQLGLAGGRGQA